MKKSHFRVTLLLITMAASLLANPIAMPTLDTIKADDITIGYHMYGSGSPILMIMGYGSTMDIWPPELISELSQTHQVIVFDNRGMGNTTAGTKEFTIAQFAQDAAGLLDGLHIKSANILGWSMGSYIAQEFAIRYPSKTSHLILYGSTIGGKDEIAPTAATLAILNDYSGTPQQIGERFFNLLFPASFLTQNPTFYKTFPQPKEHSDPQSMGKQSIAIGKWPGTAGRIDSLSVKTLILCGTEDVIVPPQNSLMLAEHIPGSWLVRIEDAGHGLMYQNPKEMGSLVNLFLSK